jgi:hypothetical protein
MYVHTHNSYLLLNAVHQMDIFARFGQADLEGNDEAS